MFRLLLYFLSLSLVQSCTTGVSMVENDFSSLLHDGNSKVWLIKELKSNGNDFAKKGEIRDLLIFFDNGLCALQSTHDLSTQNGLKGEYRANFNKKTLSITFPKEKWDFNVDIKSDNEIVLNPLPTSKTNFTLTIVPLPLLIKSP